MKDLRIGVIGSGGRGGLAAHAHRPGEGSRIVACCDIREAALARNHERYGEDVFTTKDYRELLEQGVDAVFVCTPDFLHEEHALAALEAGAAVYLEKPEEAEREPQPLGIREDTSPRQGPEPKALLQVQRVPRT